MSRAGLTKYSDELEKTRVLIPFVALGAIFREFCELSRDEIFDADPSDWADSLKISHADSIARNEIRNLSTWLPPLPLPVRLEHII